MSKKETYREWLKVDIEYGLWNFLQSSLKKV